MQIWTQNYLTRGFWGDEAWTALISRLPIPEILEVTGQDFHPPLYYLFVHVFIKLLGSSEWIRAISTFFFLLALWPLYRLVTKLINRPAGLVVTVLTAVSPILLTYAFEARAYALLLLWSVLSTWLFWRALEPSDQRRRRAAAPPPTSKWWLAYTLVGALGVYTHYYMWFILAAHGLFWLLIERHQFKRVFLSYLAIGLAQLPWIPILLSQLQSVAADYWIAPINSHTHWEFLMRIVAGDYLVTYQPLWAKATLALLGLSAVAVWWSRRRWPKGYLLLWFWLIVPVLLPSLVSLYRPVFFWRYLAFSIVPIITIIVWGVTAIKKELVLVLAAIWLGLSLRADWSLLTQYPVTMRQELEQVFATPVEEEVSVYTYLPSFAEVYFYVDGQWPVKVIPEGLVQFSGRSLLDKYVEKGWVEIIEPASAETYWQIEPGPKSTLIKP